jgi:L-rhamnose 1-dehydrogenase
MTHKSSIQHSAVVKELRNFHKAPMNGLLRNKVVAITGCSSGIGRATAIACAKHGADLFLHHLNTPAAEKDLSTLQAELKAINSSLCHSTCSGDITGPDFPRIFTSKAVSNHGRIDVLVNNAGICTFSPFQNVTRELLERHMSVNFTSAYMLAQAAAKVMAVQNSSGGSIINIASITATLGSADLTHYSATKAAILGMTVSCAVAEGPRGIRFNSICPGTIETTMNKDDLDKGGKRAEMMARVPLKRLGAPEDVANAVVFFASDLSRYVTGQYLLVDGGAGIAYQ